MYYSIFHPMNMLALITLLLLGEPHFGATWTIFFDKKIREYAYVNKITFIYGSIVLLIFSTLLFITSKNIFYLLFFGFNAYHVTRQSIGICSLFTTSAAEKNFQKKIIYLFNITIVFLSICYLMLDLIDSISAMKIGYLYLFISGIVIVFQYVKFNSWENTLTTLTGLTIFAPALFVEKPIHAIVAGVTMHYSQYLCLTFKIYLSKKDKDALNIELFTITKYLGNYFLIVVVYGIAATAITFWLPIKESLYGALLIIPILGQILHFYIDGLTWRFSKADLRELVLNHLIR